MAALATATTSLWPRASVLLPCRRGSGRQQAAARPRQRSSQKLAKPSGAIEYSLKIERRQLTGSSSTGADSEEAASARSECSLAVSEPAARETECGERVSPLEEFNTLYRNRDLVRASIKLKESNLV